MISIRMILVKSTKNTHVYSAEDEGQAVSTVYVEKKSLSKTPPEYITVTIEPES